MKIKSKLTLIVSIAALAASPIALADKAAPEVTDAEPVVIVCERPPHDEAVVDGDAGVSEENPGNDVVSEEPDDGVDPSVCEMADCEVDPAVCEMADGEGVPIDWVKRGDDGELNPNVMFQNTAGEAPLFKGETAAIGKELGQNEKASDIEAQDGPVIPQVKREKKVPIALIKKGRVFLR